MPGPSRPSATLGPFDTSSDRIRPENTSLTPLLPYNAHRANLLLLRFLAQASYDTNKWRRCVRLSRAPHLYALTWCHPLVVRPGPLEASVRARANAEVEDGGVTFLAQVVIIVNSVRASDRSLFRIFAVEWGGGHDQVGAYFCAAFFFSLRRQWRRNDTWGCHWVLYFFPLCFRYKKKQDTKFSSDQHPLRIIHPR
jgi:hypothetical protein